MASDPVVPLISSDSLEIIFHDPAPPSGPSATDKQRPRLPRWQKLANRIGSGRGYQRLQFQTLALYLRPGTNNERPLDTASRLAVNISAAGDDRSILELLLVSFCSVLSTSGRAAPEQVDNVMQTIINSSKPRYLDRIKRGATFANKLIAEWAANSSGHELQRLDRATQAVLKGLLINPFPPPRRACQKEERSRKRQGFDLN